MWIRATAFSLLSVLIAILSATLDRYIPEVGPRFKAGALDGVVDILSSSMLVVTSFSLTTMVTAFAAAATNVTPRAARLLTTDSVATNTLSTFVGSFLFSVVATVGLAAGLYNDSGRMLLFWTSLGVIAAVTVALLRWIEELTHMGRMGDTIARVEAVAVEAATHWGRQPRMGAGVYDRVPEDAEPIGTSDAGYLRFLDVRGLQKVAEQAQAELFLECLPGQFVSPARPLAWARAPLNETLRARIRKCFDVAHERNFDQDPRFGLVVLAEIASRALSPGINDPGTAIQVLGTGARVLLAYVDAFSGEKEVVFDRIFARDLRAEDLLADFIDPIARDGLSLVEVQLRVQRVLAAVAHADPPRFGELARVRAREMADLADKHIASSHARERLRERARWADSA